MDTTGGLPGLPSLDVDRRIPIFHGQFDGKTGSRHGCDLWAVTPCCFFFILFQLFNRRSPYRNAQIIGIIHVVIMSIKLQLNIACKLYIFKMILNFIAIFPVMVDLMVPSYTSCIS